MAPLLSRLGLGRSGFGFGKRTVSSGATGAYTGSAFPIMNECAFYLFMKDMR